MGSRSPDRLRYAERRRHARLGGALGLLAVAACGRDATPNAGADTPEKQFVFEGVRVEGRKSGTLAWVGTAARAAGDLTNADAEGIHIRHHPPPPATEVYDIFAPAGQLAFDDQKAVLNDVRIVTPERGVLTGGRARYDGALQHVDVDGPLEYRARGFLATAPKGEIRLDENAMTIDGPVIGRFDPEVEAPALPETAPRPAAPSGGRTDPPPTAIRP